MKYSDTNIRSHLPLALAIIHVLMWVGGIACFTVWPLPEFVQSVATPVFLWNAAALTGLLLLRHGNLALVWTGIAGFTVEVLGVQTGFPFGSYEYTDQFGPVLFGSPLVLFAAWFVLIAYTRFVTQPIAKRPSTRALLGAVWMTSIDLVIEPVATGPMAAWHWSASGIYYGVPFTNFLAWFAISFAMLYTSEKTLPPPKSDVRIILLGASLVLFFTSIAALNGCVAAAVIGLTMLACQLAFTGTASMFHSDETHESVRVPSTT